MKKDDKKDKKITCKDGKKVDSVAKCAQHGGVKKDDKKKKNITCKNGKKVDSVAKCAQVTISRPTALGVVGLSC